MSLNTPDEIADHFKDGFDAAHAWIDANPEHPAAGVFRAFVAVSHHAMNKARERAVNEGVIMPMSGGGPK